MRTILVCGGAVLLIALVVLALASSDGSRGRSSGRPGKVAAAFYPLAFAAREIGGTNVKVEDLTPPGAEPHDIEPTPEEVRDLQSADLVLLMGRGFQPQLERAARGSSGTVVELLGTPRLDVRRGDPHVWLDPVRFELVVGRVGRKMHAEQGARRLIRRLRELDRRYRYGLAHCRRREIVTSHEAFGYLGQRYALDQISITGISPEAEPTPRELQHAVDEIRASGATTVFGETLASRRIADTVARETGARTATLNPIEGLTRAQRKAGEDYFSLMYENLAGLRKALACP